MKIYRNLEDVNNIEPTVVALGNFDGVHKGHQELIRRTILTAEAAGLKSAVFTFSTHPRSVMGVEAVKNITYADEKAKIIEGLGIDYLFDIPFTDDVRTLSPEKYIMELIIGKFNMREVYCGFNHRFGFKAAGTPEVLMKLGIEHGFGVHVLEPYIIDGNLVSSTFIRGLIESGDVNLVTKYMGRSYAVEGEVVVGNRLGKKIGFPTSNLNLDENMVSPPNGVYMTQCFYDGVCYPSITNVGNKPTIGTYGRNVETHIFNFDKELYGKVIKVEFLEKLRDEKKFESIEALSKEIMDNCITAKAYHRERRKL